MGGAQAGKHLHNKKRPFWDIFLPFRTGTIAYAALVGAFE